MSPSEMQTWLERRYVDESGHWPTLSTDVSIERYVAANLPHMTRSTYWQRRPLNAAQGWLPEGWTK